MEKEVLKQIRCEKCNSTQTYMRTITNERVCRSCGHIEKIKEKKW